MKADIDENGMLTITPETPTESYALDQWWIDYSKQCTEKCTGKSSLRIIKIVRSEGEENAH